MYLLRIPLTLNLSRTVFPSGTFPCFSNATAFRHSSAVKNSSKRRWNKQRQSFFASAWIASRRVEDTKRPLSVYSSASQICFLEPQHQPEVGSVPLCPESFLMPRGAHHLWHKRWITLQGHSSNHKLKKRKRQVLKNLKISWWAKIFTKFFKAFKF